MDGGKSGKASSKGKGKQSGYDQWYGRAGKDGGKVGKADYSSSVNWSPWGKRASGISPWGVVP